MSFIEGIGDEVTVAAVLLLLFIIVLSFLYLKNSVFIDSYTTYLFQSLFSSTHQESSVNHDNRNDASIENLETTSEQTGGINTDGSVSHLSDESEQLLEQNASETVSENACADVRTDENNVTNDLNALQINEETEKDNNDSNLNQTQSVTLENDLRASNTHVEEETHNTDILNEVPEEQTVQEDNIRIRLKYLNDTERRITTKVTETVANVKRIHFLDELRNSKVIRLIYNGQLLRDEMTLHSYGICDNCVIHVFVSQAPSPSSHLLDNSSADLDVSNLMWPLFAVILGIFWVMYIRYPEFFSVTSVVVLLAFTVSFFVVYARTVMHQS